MRRSMARRPSQPRRGIALISAMLIAAIVAAAAVAVSERQHIEIRRVANIVAADRSTDLLRNVEIAALDRLRIDARRSQFDALSEDWSMNPLEASDATGNTRGSLEDLQGRFNLTNLAPSYQGLLSVTVHSHDGAKDVSDRTKNGATQQRLAEMRFRLLLAALDVDISIVQAILDWIDSDSETRFPNGAEDDYYLGLEQPYRAANRPLASVKELLLVRGVTGEIVAELEPLVITLSAPTPINVNTAPEAVLMSLAPGIDRALASMLIQIRQTEPFTSHPLLRGRMLSGIDITIKSNWFALKAVTRTPTHQFRSSTTLYRNRDRASVRGRRHGYFDG